jgi:hypothetical protein
MIFVMNEVGYLFFFFFHRTYFHHQGYSSYGNHHLPRSRWFSMKSQEMFENRFIYYIVTLIRLVTILPYKCIVSIMCKYRLKSFIFIYLYRCQ